MTAPSAIELAGCLLLGVSAAGLLWMHTRPHRGAWRRTPSGRGVLVEREGKIFLKRG